VFPPSEFTEVTLKPPYSTQDDLSLEGGKVSKSDEPEAAELCEQIGRLKVELEWLKKSCREFVTNL
jgi:hypothetical protein